jgi:hypothetical protein
MQWSLFRLWQLENEEMEAFFNAIAHFFQMRRAFIMAFTSENLWMTIKKSLFRNWQLIQNFSSRICQSLYDGKPKAQSEDCVWYLTEQLAIGCLIAN